MKKRMISLVTMVILMLGTAASAQTTYFYTDLHLNLDASQSVSTEQIVLKGEPLLVTTARYPRVAVLKEEVLLGSGVSLVKVPANTVLFGRYDDTVWTYCVLANLEGTGQAVNAIIGGVFTGGLNLLTGDYKGSALNCLQDTDNDGRFDTGWGNGVAEDSNPLIAYNLFEKKLSSTPSYERTTVDKSPTIPVRVLWSKPKTGKLSVWIETAGLSSRKQSVTLPAPGEAPGKAKIWGSEIEIMSYDAEAKTLKYRIVKGLDPQYVRIDATKTITTTYVYY